MIVGRRYLQVIEKVVKISADHIPKLISWPGKALLLLRHCRNRELDSRTALPPRICWLWPPEATRLGLLIPHNRGPSKKAPTAAATSFM